ncbi:hypothetical protein [Winogradskyella sp. R77965]|uniref:hypothetical protein n=1 Tax=Winogradskyella sp. R77965 TaxID=3093872 RepID=UPI0037DCCC59
MKKIILLLYLCLILNSCATLLNGRTTKVKIYAPEGTTIVYKESHETLNEGKAEIFPERSKDTLRFTVENDSITTTFSFRRKISPLIYLNLPYTYGLGVLVDLTNHKRFTYLRNVNVKIDTTSNQFYHSDEKIIEFKKETVFLYTSPLRAMDVFSTPMLTLGAEYFFVDDMSISGEYGTRYLRKWRYDPKYRFVKHIGRSIRFELKFYNLANIFNNVRVNEYIGLEARFIRTQTNDDISYRVYNEDISLIRNEILTIQNSVDIFNVKYGVNFPIGEQLYLDLYMGFGQRRRTIKNPNNSYQNYTRYDFYNDDNWIFPDRPRYEGIDDLNTFNFSLGFKFGIKF